MHENPATILDAFLIGAFTVASFTYAFTDDRVNPRRTATALTISILTMFTVITRTSGVNLSHLFVWALALCSGGGLTWYFLGPLWNQRANPNVNGEPPRHEPSDDTRRVPHQDRNEDLGNIRHFRKS